MILDARGNPFNQIGRTAHVGASYSARETEGWDPVAGSADLEIVPERHALTARARDLDRNNPLARNIRITKGDNVLGTGLQLSPMPNWRVLGWTPEHAAAWSKTTRAHFLDWAESRFVTSDGLGNFDRACRIMYDGAFLGGSACAVPLWRERPGTPYRTCLQLIEGDRLSTPDDKLDRASIVDGVERNVDGEITRYHVANGYHDEGLIGYGSGALEMPEWEAIDAWTEWGRQSFIHLFQQERAGQTRGKAAATAVLAQFGLAAKYQLTELQAAVVNSRIAGILETPLDDEKAAEMLGVDMAAVGEIRKNWRGDLTAGSILNLPPGTNFKSHMPGRPATAFASFMEHISREIGVGFGLPFELATRNFSKTNYSSARAALLEAWRHFRVEREWFVQGFADPVYALWLEDAIDLGRIEAPGFYQNKSAYCRAKWLAPGQFEIDRLKAANADKVELESGTLTLQRIYEARGLDWEEEVEQRARERAYVAEMDARFSLPAPTDPNSPPDEPDPDDEEEETAEQEAERREQENEAA